MKIKILNFKIPFGINTVTSVELATFRIDPISLQFSHLTGVKRGTQTPVKMYQDQHKYLTDHTMNYGSGK